MTEIPFDLALQRGLGRAVLMLREQGIGVQYRKAIQYACRNNLAYSSYESVRDAYLVDVLEASGDLEWHLPRLRKALWKPELYFDQLAMICARLTQSGQADFRDELYAAWKKRVTTLDDEVRFDGADALLWLDGVVGWQFVQKEALANPPPDEEYWRDWCFYGDLVEKVGPRAARHAGDSDPALRAVIARILRDKWTRRKKEPSALTPPPTEAEIREQLGNPAARLSLPGMGRAAPNSVILALAATVPTEKEALRGWLRIFWQRLYPLDPAPLLNLLEHPDSQVSWWALKAIKQVQHPDVRVFAEKLVSSHSPLRVEVCRLLANNPGPNDAALLEQVWESLTDEDEVHDLGFGFSEYAEANPQETPIWLGIALYENCPCSLCRGSFARWLVKRGVAPDWLLAELAWDSEEDTRAYSVSS